MYFRLKPEVYLIAGAKQDCLCNVLNGEIILLNQEMAEQLSKAEVNEEIISNENIEKLIEMGWGEEVSGPVFVDKVRYTNKFNKTRAWKLFPEVGMVILQLTGHCNSECGNEKCDNSFCPMCVKEEYNNELTGKQWEEIITKLSYLKPKQFMLTGGNPLYYKEFQHVLKYLKSKNYPIAIHVTDLESAKKLKDEMVYLSCFDWETVKVARTMKNVRIVSEWDVSISAAIKVNMGSPKITKESFMKKKNFGEIFTRMLYDDCLFGKITIMSNGDLVPCMGHKELVIGNMLQGDITQNMKDLYEKYWCVSVDERHNQKCQSCCLRYNCHSCSKYSDKMCSYDVAEGKWK